LSSANKILMICTDKYVDKANNGQGGVGYEKMIITSSLMKKINENKIIPVIRQIGGADVPTFLKSKLYIDFSKPDDYEFSYDELVRTIHNSPLFEKPPIGNNPFKPIVKEKLDDDIKILDKLLVSILTEQGTNNYALSNVIINSLGISPILFKISMARLIEKGFAKWYTQHSRVVGTDKGLLYAFENKLVT
jgi:hypothetical protein